MQQPASNSNDLNHMEENNSDIIPTSNDSLERAWKGKTDLLASRVESLEKLVAHLQGEVDALSTGKAAIRQLAKSTLKRINLYDLIYDNHQVFVPIYNFFSRDKWRPSTIYRATMEDPLMHAQSMSIKSAQKQQKNNLTRPTLVEATSIEDDIFINLNNQDIECAVFLRQITDEMLSIEDIRKFSSIFVGLKKVLCLGPDQTTLHLLLCLSRLGAEVSCISLSTISEDLATSSCDLHDFSLSDLLMRDKNDLDEYDAIILGSLTNRNDINLLKQCLSSKTRFLTVNIEPDELDISDLICEKDSEILIGSLRIYKLESSIWTSPIENLYDFQEHGYWPWKVVLNNIPEKMPSGRDWPKISIVTAIYNSGKFLEETIRSVIYQGYPNLEYIVIDGGSSDNTLKLLHRYNAEIAVWVSETDKGQSNAINKGFQRATGAIFAWLNGDDCYPPGSLFKVAMAFDKYNSDLIVGGCEVVRNLASEPSHTHHSLLPIGETVNLPLTQLLDLDNCWQKGHFFHQPEVFWQREIWQKSGGFVDESLYYSMDYDLWVRMAACGAKVTNVPDILATFRIHSDQKTYGSELPFLPELKTVNENYLKKFN